MEATVLIRTVSGRFLLPTATSDHHHGGPVLSRTRSAGAFCSRSAATAVHLQMRDQNHRQDMDGVHRAAASSSLFLNNSSGRSSSTKSVVLVEQLDLHFSGAGAGRGGGRPGVGSSGDHSSGMGAYYKEMLQADPENPLLLINYGKFLREVQGDLHGAEDCFGRAVLASPGDGEALSLYGNLMWEAHRDEQRADDYLQRAVQAAPDDCYVLGSYANFLWDFDRHKTATGSVPSSAPAVMVKAY